MPIDSPLSPSSARPSAGAADRETAPLEVTPVALRDTLDVLDHRSRRRAVPVDRALPGHYLAFGDGNGVAHLLPIDAKVIHLGRAGTADVRFEDPRVSRRHAILVRYGRHVRVLDDRSSTGTFVNGARVIATDLAEGDVVRLGPVGFTYTVVR
jgi:hypothetical protein